MTNDDPIGDATAKFLLRLTRAGWIDGSIASKDLVVDWNEDGKKCMLGLTKYLDVIGYDFSPEELQCLYFLRCHWISAPTGEPPPPCGYANQE